MQPFQITQDQFIEIISTLKEINATVKSIQASQHTLTIKVENLEAKIVNLEKADIDLGNELDRVMDASEERFEKNKEAIDSILKVNETRNIRHENMQGYFVRKLIDMLVPLVPILLIGLGILLLAGANPIKVIQFLRQL